MLAFAGCATRGDRPAQGMPSAPVIGPEPRVSERAAEEPVEAPPMLPEPARSRETGPTRTVDKRPPEQPAQVLAPVPGQALMMVHSQPAGAMIVLDGRPLGHAPMEVAIPVTERGFLSRPVSVKVRFLVADAAMGSSTTTEVVLTQLDRAPVRIDVTPEGSKRILGSLDG